MKAIEEVQSLNDLLNEDPEALTPEDAKPDPPKKATKKKATKKKADAKPTTKKRGRPPAPSIVVLVNHGAANVWSVSPDAPDNLRTAKDFRDWLKGYLTDKDPAVADAMEARRDATYWPVRQTAAPCKPIVKTVTTLVGF